MYLDNTLGAEYKTKDGIKIQITKQDNDLVFTEIDYSNRIISIDASTGKTFQKINTTKELFRVNINEPIARLIDDMIEYMLESTK